MTPSKHTRFALFQRKEATKNKVVIDISDDEVITDSEISREGNETPTQNLSNNYCENCGKKIAEGGKLSDFCFVMGSYDSELFGYNLNALESPMEEESMYEMVSPDTTRKFCTFWDHEIPLEDGEIPIGDENCEECLFQAARERDGNILGYVPCHYDMSYFDKEPLSPAAHNLEFINITEEEEEEDPEEEMEGEEEEY